MDKVQITELVDEAFRQQREILRDPHTDPKFRFEVTKDILDRGGFPKITATKVQSTTRVFDGEDLRRQRQELLAEFQIIKKELGQIEGGSASDEQFRGNSERADKEVSNS